MVNLTDSWKKVQDLNALRLQGSASNKQDATFSIAVNPLLAKQESFLADQFRKLRNVLRVHHSANDLRSVLVTSLTAGEGKTTISLNLASAIAKNLDDTVLLVDADLRKRGLTSLLGLQQTQGLSDVLMGEATINKALVQTEIKGLTIMAAGLISSEVLELLTSKRMTKMINELRHNNKFSYIIVDSPPLIAASEVHGLTNIVDGIIFVIMAEKTRRDLVMRELSSIDRMKILGIVLNGANFEISQHYQKYCRSYYGKDF